MWINLALFTGVTLCLSAAVPAPAVEGPQTRLRARATYFGTKLLLAIVLLWSWRLVRPGVGWWWQVGITLVGLFAIDAGRMLYRRRRRERIRGGLSFFLDMVVALLQSGLLVDEALRRAARDGLRRRHPLAREIERTLRAIGHGRDRGSAFEDLARRTGVGELTAVVTTFTVGVRLGGSMEDLLVGQAAALRTLHGEKMEKQVQRSAVLALLPVTLCVLPMFLLFVFLPASTEIIHTLEQLRALR